MVRPVQEDCPCARETGKGVERELAAAFGIRSIPTLLFIPMEGDPQVAMGALPEETLKEAIDNFLLKADEDGK